LWDPDVDALDFSAVLRVHPFFYVMERDRILRGDFLGRTKTGGDVNRDDCLIRCVIDFSYKGSIRFLEISSKPGSKERIDEDFIFSKEPVDIR
jgi:hypothetical protein